MELTELLTALHEELESAGVSPKGASASLAFISRKNREGTIEIDFVDSGAMSKPRPEELHRLKVTLGDRPKLKVEATSVTAKENDGEDSPFQVVAKPAGMPKSGRPPALPPKRV